jgi:hypothetical protein
MPQRLEAGVYLKAKKSIPVCCHLLNIYGCVTMV